MARKQAKKGRSISIDMTDVESSSRMEDGDYVATVTEVEQKESQEGNEYLSWKLKTSDDKTLYHNTSLQPQALWNLRNTLEAMGLEVPAKAIDIDLDDLVGLELGVSVENEIYQGKRKPRVIDVFSSKDSPEEVEEETEDEEEPEEVEEEEPESEDPEEETEEAEEDELDEMSRVELKQLLKERGVSLKVLKSTSDDEIRDALRAAASDEPEEEEEDDGEESFSVGDKVTFMDEKKKLSGKVKKVNLKEGFCEVQVGKEDWEIEFSDLTKA